MSLNVDELLVNADWPKQTCDWPLSELGLCDQRPVAASGFDESEHPRHPSGTSEGGRFAPKDGLEQGLRDMARELPEGRSWLALQDMKPGDVFHYVTGRPDVWSIQWFRFEGLDENGGFITTDIGTGETMVIPGDVDLLRVETYGPLEGASGNVLEPMMAQEMHESPNSSSHKLYDVTLEEADGPVEYLAKRVEETADVVQLRDSVEPGRDLERELAAQIMAEEIRNAGPSLGLDLYVAKVTEGNVQGLGHVILSKKVYGDNIPSYDAISIGEARALSLYDYVIGNTDRHMGNMIYTAPGGKTVAIDQGLAFPSQNMARQGQFHIMDFRRDGNELRWPDGKQGEVVSGLLDDWERIDQRLSPYLTEDERRAMWRRLEYLNNGTGQFPSQQDWNDGAIDELVRGYGWHESVTLGRDEEAVPTKAYFEEDDE